MPRKTISVGTISFRIYGSAAIRFCEQDRGNLIADVAINNSPDVLLCSGFSLESFSEIDSISTLLRDAKCPTTICLEAQGDARKSLKGSATIYCVTAYNITPLGSQKISERENSFEGVKYLSAEISKRKFEVKGHIFCTLMCGEILIVDGQKTKRHNTLRAMKGFDPKSLNGVSCILNPTHSFMPSRLEPKREWLARNFNCNVVRSSNWGVFRGKKVGKKAKTLHRAHGRDGNSIANTADVCDEKSFEYREFKIR